MFKATIKNKEKVSDGYAVTVEFSDGETTVQEVCKPQDLNGFVYWVKGRLSAFNCEKDIDATYNVDDEVVIDTPEPTQDEIDFNEWRRNFARLETVQRLIDIGVVANDNPKVVALRTKVQTDIKADYIDRL